MKSTKISTTSLISQWVMARTITLISLQRPLFRYFFEQVLPMRSEPLRRARVLSNIMLTYEREGNKGKTVAVCRKILDIPGLQETFAGIRLHREVAGQLALLEGRPISVWGGPVGLFAAYFSGAALGAALGPKAYGIGGTLFCDLIASTALCQLIKRSLINEDPRYGGAGVGAFLGVILFSRIAIATGPALSGIAGIGCFFLTAYILLEKNRHSFTALVRGRG